MARKFSPRPLTWASSAVLMSGLVLACGRHDTPVATQLGSSVAAAGQPDPLAAGRDAGQPRSLISGEQDGGQSPSAADLAQCVVTKQEARLPPVYLLFLLDQSGTMGDGMYGDRTLKWDPVSSALKSFFADSESMGLRASLTLFPPDINKMDVPADESISDESLCRVSSYTTPNVPMTALPQLSPFAAAIDEVTPPNEWGTPTQIAMTGVVAQADQLLAETPEAITSIILVTDGEPAQCDDNSLSGTLSVAESVNDRIRTYVVGVGPQLDALNDIARAGGTEPAFLVPINDPTETRDAMLETFSQIKVEVLPCETPIPPPPPGRVFEKEKVAVEYSIDGSTVVPVQYDSNCGNGGWRYDSVDEPREIQLCQQTCDRLQGKRDAKLVVTFACQVLIPSVK